MRVKLFLLASCFILCFTKQSVAQCSVTIPDSSFRSYLLSNLSININSDSLIQCSEAAAFNGSIYAYNSNISDLTGIEAFTALTYLSVDGNNLTSLDLSSNIALTDIYCQGNQLTNLNVTGLTALYAMNCSNNQLTSLNISTCSALTNLNCNNNQLTNLNVTSNTALVSLDCSTNLLTNLNTPNPSLTTLTCNNNQLVGLDVSANPNLSVLSCYQNQITALDVSTNTALSNLSCSYNLLTVLDLSSNTSLNYLDCAANQLSNLDVSANAALISLGCHSNLFTALDVSADTALTILACNLNNNLAYLNVQNGHNTILWSFVATNCPNLLCILVDSVAYANTNWSGGIDAGTTFNTNCPPPCVVSIPDANFKTILLADTAINTNNDGEIQCLEASNFNGTINVNSANISDLTGIEAFTALNILYCNSNNLTTINVSSNTALTVFQCGYNQITSLDISSNTALTNLDCSSNLLTNLDVSSNTALSAVYCYLNQITSLDLSTNTSLATLNCNGNPLTNLNISANTSLYYLLCGGNQLASLDLSANPTLSYLDCGASTLTNLNLSANSALTHLDCSGTMMASLDVSSNSALSELKCYGTSITSLDVSANPALTLLLCNYNNLLTTLNIRNGNIQNLVTFDAGSNPALVCILVDSAAYMNSSWSGAKDSLTTFSSDCSPVAFFSASPVSGCAPLNVNFTNSSTGALSYNWNFGDGNTSSLQNPPAELYLIPGIYTVELIASNGYGSDTAAGIITANNFTDIIGTLSYSSGIVAGASVFLIAQGISSTLYDTVATVNADGAGLYTFTAQSPGNYYVRAEAGVSFPLLINTYFGEAYLWDSASVISHGCVSADTADIAMVELPPSLSGPCSLSGYVYEAAGFGQKQIAGSNPVIMVNVIPGVPVKVGRNPSGTIVASGTTDSSGYFSFSNLPYDTYTIYTDIPGYPMDSTYTLSFTSGNETVTNLDYFVDSNSVYIDATLAVKNSFDQCSAFSVFPNPTSGSIYVRFSGPGLQSGNIHSETIRLYDLSGRMIYSNRDYLPGNTIFHLDLNELGISQGTYLLDIQQAGKKVRVSFVK
jgi:Leucine-rich repeat (LRR) protein/PKD repeat protein